MVVAQSIWQGGKWLLEFCARPSFFFHGGCYSEVIPERDTWIQMIQSSKALGVLLRVNVLGLPQLFVSHSQANSRSAHFFGTMQLDSVRIRSARKR